MALKNKNKKIHSEDYAYATGRIRALENTLMSRDQIYRLFDAPDIESISKIISESGYNVSGSVDSAVKKDISDTFTLVRELSPGKDFIDILMLENDYHNLKVIINKVIPKEKEKEPDQEFYDEIKEDSDLEKEDDISGLIESAKRDVSLSDLSDYLVTPGVYEPSDLLQVVLGEDGDFSDDYVKKLIPKALKEYKRTGESAAVDRVTDRMYYKRLLEISAELGDKIFSEYCGTMVDIANIEMFLRSGKMDFEKDVLSSFLLDGNNVSAEDLLAVYGKETEKLKDLFKNTNCEVLCEFAGNYNTREDAAEYARQADSILTEIMRKSKRVLFGPSVLIAYLYARQLQAKNINIAITCKRNGLESSLASKLMREPF